MDENSLERTDMQIENNYEINISKKGKHFARMELGWQFPDTAKEIYDETRQIFESTSDEFRLTLYEVTCSSRSIITN